ncbi:hypothetical protein VUR80DRAFT_8937 [Thermomyces stellatus]
MVASLNLCKRYGPTPCRLATPNKMALLYALLLPVPVPWQCGWVALRHSLFSSILSLRDDCLPSKLTRQQSTRTLITYLCRSSHRIFHVWLCLIPLYMELNLLSSSP